jgi:hypothetical protein
VKRGGSLSFLTIFTFAVPELLDLIVIDVHNRVQNSGYPNYLCCRIPVKSGINISLFRQNVLDYDDKIICEFLEFGAPIAFRF